MNITRKRIAQILESSTPKDKVGWFFDLFLVTLIMINVIAIVLASVASIEAKYAKELHWLEIFSVIVFSIEYAARLWSCVDVGKINWRSPIKGRLRYLLSPAAVIDLIAILPFYLSFLVAIDLRFLRVIRLLRIFKLTRYSAAMQVLLDVLAEEGRIVFAAFFLLFILLMLTSSGIYLIEHDVQPEAFGSIPAAMWWAMATLTTVGYGDIVPVTGWGKFFGGCISVIGMGMVALPAGILASGFSDQLHRRREQYSAKLNEIMEDGVVSGKEKSELDSLRESLDLDPADADRLFKAYQREINKMNTVCPYCSEVEKE